MKIILCVRIRFKNPCLIVFKNQTLSTNNIVILRKMHVYKKNPKSGRLTCYFNLSRLTCYFNLIVLLQLYLIYLRYLCISRVTLRMNGIFNNIRNINHRFLLRVRVHYH